MPQASTIKMMFAGISPRYDLLNRILSLGVDRRWRRRAVRAVSDGLFSDGGADAASRARREGIDGPAGARRGSALRALDVCCGTGDLSLDLARAGFSVTGVDFCREMLIIGREKVASSTGESVIQSGSRPRGVIDLAEADALNLPLRDSSFDAACVAFGVRNLEDLDAGLREFARVIRSGGRIAVLEFGRPRGAIMRALYRVYLNVLVPLIGRLVSGRAGAYAYLSSSIQAFPDQTSFPERLRRAGFTETTTHDLTFGVAALYVGRRS